MAIALKHQLTRHLYNRQHDVPMVKTVTVVLFCQVEESTPFAPIARKEIGALAWHLVNELPMTREQSALVCCPQPEQACPLSSVCCFVGCKRLLQTELFAPSAVDDFSPQSLLKTHVQT